MTLKSNKSNMGGAEREELLFGSFSTMSQRLVRRVGQPFTVCGPMEMISPNCPQCLRSCWSMTSLDKTGTFIILIGMNKDAVPAGGSGWVVKCLVVKGELRKSCCASPVGKQTSKRETSALDTTTVAEGGILSIIASNHSSTNPEGSGRKAE